MKRPWFKCFGLPSAALLLCLSLLPVLGGCSFYKAYVPKKGPCYEERDYPENRMREQQREQKLRMEQKEHQEEGETEREPE